MGLDISVYTSVKPTFVHELSDECWEVGHIRTPPADFFPRSMLGVLPDRCYVSIGDEWGFHGGSYSGYNYFRELLCSAALGPGITPQDVWSDPEKYADKPFIELINFSDCEGAIGSVACANLAADFDAYPLLGETFPDDGWGSWQERYVEWGKAFHDAAGSGLIDFH